MQILESRLTEETEPELISAVTDAVVRTFGEEIRESVWVVLEPVPAHRWGVAGKGVAPRPS
ncbi:tautomerase family protein [Goodfellowiella coeruleoviolacea]|uniref:tautomerase family protein n=1 Tax=Goodfellowiella coeruleoviolacea TaxID=334858 RepID=UPI0020A50CF4|nr:tautomerase family protein [Goodfellowiella coeruleoviolacea]